MKNIVNKILVLIAILGIVISQSIVFANNVGLDPNGHIEMPMSIKTNRAETIGIKNLQNYQLSYQLVETPSDNYKNYVAFIEESNAKKAQLVNEKNQLKSIVEAAQAEDDAKYKIYSALNSDVNATREQRQQAKAEWDKAKEAANKAMEPYQAKLNEMESYNKLTEETLKNYIPLYDDTKWQTSDGTFTIPSNNDGKERIVTVWVKVTDQSGTYYEATMYPFNLGKAENPPKRYTLEIEEGKEYNLIIENYNPIDFKWTIDQPDIIEVVNGKIIGKKEGTATLDGISNDGKTKVSVLVTVKPRTPNNNQNDNNQNNNNQNNNNQNNDNQNNDNQNNNNQNNNQNNNNQNNNNQNNNQNNNNQNNNQPTKPNPVETDRNIPNNNTNTNNTNNNNNQNNINRKNTNNTQNNNSNFTQNTREINSGLEKDTPKSPERLPQTGDIPLGAVIAMSIAGAMAVIMLVKVYKLRRI